MSIKKITALALAMIISVVPVSGITVSAAEAVTSMTYLGSVDKILYIQKNDENIGGYDMMQVSVDNTKRGTDYEWQMEYVMWETCRGYSETQAAAQSRNGFIAVSITVPEEVSKVTGGTVSFQIDSVSNFKSDNNYWFYVGLYPIDYADTVSASSFDEYKGLGFDVYGTGDGGTSTRVQSSEAIGNIADDVEVVKTGSRLTFDVSDYVSDAGPGETIRLAFRAAVPVAGVTLTEPKFEIDAQLREKSAELRLEAFLGWDNAGKVFTVNFKVVNEAGESADAPVTVTYTVPGEDGSDKEITVQSDGDVKGITVQTDVTNRIYTAVIDGTTYTGKAVRASVYSLVVDEIVNGGYDAIDPGKLDSVRIAAANNVIANGGIVFTEALTSEANRIMTLSNDKKTVEMKENARKLGIGFIVTDDRLYVGGDDMTVSAVEYESDIEAKVYSKLTINEDGKSVTLSGLIGENGEVIAAEAVTLSLESVNVEFIETLISENEADGTDAEFDFTPEL